MAILETAASKAAGPATYRSTKGNGFAKNVSLIFVRSSAAAMPWYLGARDLHEATLETVLELTIYLVDFPELGPDTGTFNVRSKRSDSEPPSSLAARAKPRMT
ncbi:hypothetical protein E5D57_005448 [Metarhizium anisopliae]|nr:hypothetical protein E5D57_005448 [Metarhizium anisopliae]